MMKFGVILIVLCLFFCGCRHDDGTGSSEGPVISGIRPSMVSPGQQGVTLVISGQGFNGIVAVDAGPNMVVRRTTIRSSQELAVRVNVQANAPSGFQTVRVTTSEGEAVSTEHLQIASNPAPVENRNPPVAHMNITPKSGTTTTEFLFDGSTSTDSDGTIKSYVWDFGDGSSAQGKTARHRYSLSGLYTVRLTVTDNHELEGSVEKDLNLPGSPPVASFTVTPPSGPPGTLFVFNAEASTDSDGTINEYRWSFSDGKKARGVIMDRRFPGAGSYTATLTVIDNQGMTGAISKAIEVGTGSGGGTGGGTGTACTNPVERRADPIFGRLVSYDESGISAVVRFYDQHTCETAWFDCGDLRKTTPERFYGIMTGMEDLGDGTFRIYTKCPVSWPPFDIGEEIVIVWRKCEDNHCPTKK